MTELIIDTLSDQAIKAASLIWKKDLAETREIIYRSIEAHEITQRLTVPQFQEYLQLKVRPKFFSHCPVCAAETPPAFTNCPACNVNLEIVRDQAIKDLALEFTKFGFLMGQSAPPPPPKKKITLYTVIGWIAACFLALLGYGIFKDLILFPLLYPAQPIRPPTNTPVILRPNTQPAPTLTATPTDSCLLWSQVTAQMEGRTVCVYGTVTSHTEDYTNELTRFYFGTIDQFFLVSNFKWDKPFEGECITTTGEILLNTYQVPYIKIEDRIDFCP